MLSSCSNGRGETTEAVMTYPSPHQALAGFLAKKTPNQLGTPIKLLRVQRLVSSLQ